MKTFILRKNGVVTRTDSDYKSFGMEPQNLFSPLTEIEKKLQFARGEIQMRVHKALLSAGAGRHGVSCTSLRTSDKSLSFTLSVSSIKERDFKEDKMKKADVKSAVSSTLKEFFGSRAVGSVSVSVRISKGTHDPRIAPTYRIAWDVTAALKVGRKDSSSASRVDVYDLSATHEVVVRAGKLELKRISSQMREARATINTLSSRLEKLKRDTAYFGEGSLFGEASAEVKKEILALESEIKELLPFAH